jgi:hypothetical protein
LRFDSAVKQGASAGKHLFGATGRRWRVMAFKTLNFILNFSAFMAFLPKALSLDACR